MTNTTRCVGNRVFMSGQATVEQAQGLLGVVREAFGHGGPVVIDITEMTRADLTFVQLLASAERTARETGVSLSLHGDVDVIRRAAGDSPQLEVLLDAVHATPSGLGGK